MIDCTVKARERKIEVRWFHDDSIKKVYLFIRPLTPFKRLDEENKRLWVEDSRETVIGPRTIYKAPCQTLDLPNLYAATYCFSVFSNESGRGEPLCTKESYIGNSVSLTVERQPYRGRLERFTVSCKYSVENDLFWLSFSKVKSDCRFYLPPMAYHENYYTTSCFLAQGAYENLALCLDSSIKDCIKLA